MMFVQKFMDGTPVDAEYAAQVSSMVASACDAEEAFSLDDLEEYAEISKGRMSL